MSGFSEDMPFFDESGEKAPALFGEEIGQRAIEPGAVARVGHDDLARLGHDFSIRAARA